LDSDSSIESQVFREFSHFMKIFNKLAHQKEKNIHY